MTVNTWFKRHDRRLWTWRDPGDRLENQTNFVNVNHHFINAFQQEKVDLEQNAVATIIMLYSQPILRCKNGNIPFQKQNYNGNCYRLRGRYEVAVKDRLEVVEIEDGNKWKLLRGAIIKTGRNWSKQKKKEHELDRR